MVGGVAVIPISGAMMKARSKYGGTSSIDVRRMVRHAAANGRISAILLHVDCPGGTLAGTDALATDVAVANSIKPVFAHCEDLCASAAYCVVSQARRITATRTSLIGSLGTRLVLVDSSKAAEKEGLEVIDFSTGEYKSAGQDGTEITKSHRAYFQGIVDTANTYFMSAVAKGRRMEPKQIDTVFDGRLYDADAAVGLGLVDEVIPFDQALAAIQQQYPTPTDQADPDPRADDKQTADRGSDGPSAAYPASLRTTFARSVRHASQYR